jgi:hypothetical protein
MNGDPACNILSNLIWGTRLENARDRTTHGTHPRGERHKNAKLSDEKVIEIRRIFDGVAKNKPSQKSVAARLGVSEMVVNGVVRRTAWAHVR